MLDHQPVGLRLDERPRAFELGALEEDRELAFLDPLAHLALGLGAVVEEEAVLVRGVGAGVPDDDGPRAVLAFRDHALVAGVAHGVVLGHHGEAFVRGGVGRAFGDGERLEDAVDFEADIVVQAAGVVLLDDEDQPPVAGRRRIRRRL